MNKIFQLCFMFSQEIYIKLETLPSRNTELDLGSIRSSPRDGLTTPCRLIIRNMGDLHIVLPALNLSNLNAGILMMMQQVRLMMFSLNMVDYSMSFLLLST